MKKLHGVWFRENRGGMVLVIRESVAGIARDDTDPDVCSIVMTGGVEFQVSGSLEIMAASLGITIDLDS